MNIYRKCSLSSIYTNWLVTSCKEGKVFVLCFVPSLFLCCPSWLFKVMMLFSPFQSYHHLWLAKTCFIWHCSVRLFTHCSENQIFHLKSLVHWDALQGQVLRSGTFSFPGERDPDFFIGRSPIFPGGFKSPLVD